MSIREYEAHNVVLPLKNSTAMKDIANIAVSTAGAVQCLASLFRGSEDGHYLSVQADGAKMYVAFGSNELGMTLGLTGLSGFAIDPGVTGTGTQVAWPIPDGVTIAGIQYGGKEIGSTNSYAPTLANYNYLHARVASGGVSTGFLRLQRSSLAPGQDPGQFFRNPT